MLFKNLALKKKKKNLAVINYVCLHKIKIKTK